MSHSLQAQPTMWEEEWQAQEPVGTTVPAVRRQGEMTAGTQLAVSCSLSLGPQTMFRPPVFRPGLPTSNSIWTFSHRHAQTPRGSVGPAESLLSILTITQGSRLRLYFHLLCPPQDGLYIHRAMQTKHTAPRSEVGWEGNGGEGGGLD